MIEIANAYFASLPDELLALQINPNRLTAPLKFEPPVHPAGQPPATNADILFPHIYGPLNRQAIVRVFALQRGHSGRWQMPEDIVSQD